MNTHIALLRGVNVGGRNKLPMNELAAMFEHAGCHEVRTYIQSGNVIFAAGDELVARIPRLIRTKIEGRFGYQIPVLLRSAERMAEIVAGNPWAADDLNEKHLHVAFLADEPTDDALAALDARRSPPEELVARGSDIYLRLPGGVARTKLTNAHFDRVLGTVSTMRNWRTTKKLVELSGG